MRPHELQRRQTRCQGYTYGCSRIYAMLTTPYTLQTYFEYSPLPVPPQDRAVRLAQHTLRTEAQTEPCNRARKGAVRQPVQQHGKAKLAVCMHTQYANSKVMNPSPHLKIARGEQIWLSTVDAHKTRRVERATRQHNGLSLVHRPATRNAGNARVRIKRTGARVESDGVLRMVVPVKLTVFGQKLTMK